MDYRGSLQSEHESLRGTEQLRDCGQTFQGTRRSPSRFVAGVHVRLSLVHLVNDWIRRSRLAQRNDRRSLGQRTDDRRNSTAHTANPATTTSPTHAALWPAPGVSDYERRQPVALCPVNVTNAPRRPQSGSHPAADECETMKEVSLKEHIANQQRLKAEMACFRRFTTSRCERCEKQAGLSRLNGELLCPNCWKWEIAYLEGRTSRTGSIATVGNSRAALNRSVVEYHGSGVWLG